MFAYHFPPVAVSSGVQRTLSFSRNLPDLGWDASVVTVRPGAYERTHPGQLGDVHLSTHVIRTPALDAARHLTVFGRYPRVLATPDRWRSWLPFAVAAGVREARRQRVDCIWSTFPIATAHLAALAVQRRTGLAWVADFRDSMSEQDYPTDPRLRRALRRIESDVVARAARCVFTAPGTLAMYARRYPEARARFSIIENGFDEDSFVQAGSGPDPEPTGGPLRLVHAGVLYPSERDPRAFFAALARLRDQGAIRADGVRVVLRASGHDARHRDAIAAAGVADLVELAPPLPYVQALREMLHADGLLLFQASNCNHQIPAKLYEYLRAGKPVFALTDPTGDTAATLIRCGLGPIVPLHDEEAIVRELPAFIDGVRAGTIHGASADTTAQHTRQARSVQLAALLDEVIISS
jgi:glycosyltransferase involved in cell wall biosynthesis